MKTFSALQRAIWDRVAAEIAGGLLRCAHCGRERPADEVAVRGFVERGWPVCCGRTMKRSPDPLVHQEAM